MQLQIITGVTTTWEDCFKPVFYSTSPPSLPISPDTLKLTLAVPPERVRVACAVRVRLRVKIQTDSLAAAPACQAAPALPGLRRTLKLLKLPDCPSTTAVAQAGTPPLFPPFVYIGSPGNYETLPPLTEAASSPEAALASSDRLPTVACSCRRRIGAGVSIRSVWQAFPKDEGGGDAPVCFVCFLSGRCFQPWQLLWFVDFNSYDSHASPQVL